MTKKDKYREICKSEQLELYMQDWWLDAVCVVGVWDVVLIERQKKVIAAFPYYRIEKFGTKQIVMPPFTQTLGPWISESYLQTKSENKRHAESQSLTQELIEGIPLVDRFSYNLTPTVFNGLPFVWAGYQQTVRYTQIVSEIPDFHSVAKRKISLALKNQVTVKDGAYDTDFIQLIKELNQLKGTTNNIQLIESIYSKSEKKGQLKHFSAYNQSGTLLGSIVLFLDAQKGYILLDLATRKTPNYGAQYLLYKSAIDFCIKKELTLDFEGSMIKEIEKRNRYMGGVQSPYISLSKYKTKFHEILFRIRNK